MLCRFSDEIVVFCGPMYSGKSCSMIVYLNKLKYAKIPYKIFKPDMDRFADVIQTRYAGISEQAVPIDIAKPELILEHIDKANVSLPFTVAVDEAQFFHHGILDVVKELNRRGIQVLIAGLDVDAWGDPFGPMPNLLAFATKVIKNVAVCTRCGDEAIRTATEHPKKNNSNIVVGNEEIFFPACSKCF